MRYVYVIRNLITEKVYVGQTKNITQRKAGHFYAARKGNERPLYRSIRKHGAENFSFEVIEECDDEIINEREQFWVAHFDSFNPEKGYNLTSGGNAATSVSLETRRKLSVSLTGLTKSVEHKTKISQSRKGWIGLRGTKNPQFKIRRDKEHCRKISEKLKLRIGSKNCNAKLNEEIVRQIKQKFANGARVCDLVREYDMSYSQLNRIKFNKCWQHVDIACDNL